MECKQPPFLPQGPCWLEQWLDCAPLRAALERQLDARDALALAGTDRATRAVLLETPTGTALLGATLRRGPAALRVAPPIPTRGALEEVGGRVAARRALLDPTRAVGARVFAAAPSAPASVSPRRPQPASGRPPAAPLAAIAERGAAAATLAFPAPPGQAAGAELARVEVARVGTLAGENCLPAHPADPVARHAALWQATAGAQLTWAPDRTRVVITTLTGVWLIGPGALAIALPEADRLPRAVYGPGEAAVLLHTPDRSPQWCAYDWGSGTLTAQGDGPVAFIAPATLVTCTYAGAGLAWTALPLRMAGRAPDALPCAIRLSAAAMVAAWGGTLPADWPSGLPGPEGRRCAIRLAGDGTRLALATQRAVGMSAPGPVGPLALDVLVVDRARGTTLMFRDVQRSDHTLGDITWLWSGSGRLIALGCHDALDDETPCLLDLATGRQVTLASRPGAGVPLSFSPSEAVLACAARPGTVALYDTTSGALMRPTAAATAAPPAWSADERRIAFDGGSDGVRVLYLDRPAPPPCAAPTTRDPPDAARAWGLGMAWHRRR